MDNGIQLSQSPRHLLDGHGEHCPNTFCSQVLLLPIWLQSVLVSQLSISRAGVLAMLAFSTSFDPLTILPCLRPLISCACVWVTGWRLKLDLQRRDFRVQGGWVM